MANRKNEGGFESWGSNRRGKGTKAFKNRVKKTRGKSKSAKKARKRNRK